MNDFESTTKINTSINKPMENPLINEVSVEICPSFFAYFVPLLFCVTPTGGKAKK
jgi:hypothetical protein